MKQEESGASFAFVKTYLLRFKRERQRERALASIFQLRYVRTLTTKWLTAAELKKIS